MIKIPLTIETILLKGHGETFPERNYNYAQLHIEVQPNLGQ